MIGRGGVLGALRFPWKKNLLAGLLLNAGVYLVSPKVCLEIFHMILAFFSLQVATTPRNGLKKPEAKTPYSQTPFIQNTSIDLVHTEKMHWQLPGVGNG